MLESTPVPIQAILWPLLGAAAILIVGRLLPNGLRRLVALVATVASLSALWSMRGGVAESVHLFWEPLNLFRLGPTLAIDSQPLLVGITLAWLTAAIVLSIRGDAGPRENAPGGVGTQPNAGGRYWHALILVALAGCLSMTMASNLLTLALGSALLDIALLAVVVLAPGNANRVAWRIAAPGVASTIVLILSALQMDAQIGTASLLAKSVPAEALILVGIAGVLRLLIFPLHPRDLHTPENASLSLLVAGAGLYLLLRVQGIEPVLTDRSWLVVVGGVAMGAGGLVAWTGAHTPAKQGEMGSRAEVGWNRIWPGLAIFQVGYATAFVAFVGAAEPWPFLAMTMALGLLAIWWEDRQHKKKDGTATWSEPLRRRAGAQWTRVQEALAQAPGIGAWLAAWLGPLVKALPPLIALASLAGAPLTVGAMGRWPFYASLIHRGQGSLLVAFLVADVFFAAGLWAAVALALRQARAHGPGLVGLLAMVLVAAPLVVLGIAPNSLDLHPVETADVSVLLMVLIYVAPWLLGGLLARVSSSIEDLMMPLHRIVGLGWLFRVADWLGQRTVNAVHWLGRVGEGEGWWGWALIILALGAVFLAVR